MDRTTKREIYKILAELYWEIEGVTQIELVNMATEKFGEPFTPNTLRKYILEQRKSV